MDTFSSSVISFNSNIFNTGVTIYASVVNQCFKWLKTHYLKTEQYRHLLLYAFFFQMSTILLIWLFMQIVLSVNGEDKMNSLETK